MTRIEGCIIINCSSQGKTNCELSYILRLRFTIMDYITNKINNRIAIVKNIKGTTDLLVHYQSKLEYQLMLLLGFLWNKNRESLDEIDKEQLYQLAQRPTIGDVVDMCKRLDVQNTFRNNKRFSKAIVQYPKLRNGFLGHGYTYADGQDSVIAQLEELSDAIQDSRIEIFHNDLDFVYVTSVEDSCYKGICYKSKGESISWNCPVEVGNLQPAHLYASYGIGCYSCLSPFLEIDNFGSGIYVYCNIEEKLLGKIKYNRLLETGVKYIEWEEIAKLCISSDGTKMKTSNGTIINIFDRNYKKYIGVGIKNKLREFLTKNMSSVCATIWGHGGVGKTATVQSVCEDLANETYKHFDYIIFMSAKDRRYNMVTGNIEQISGSITTYEELVSGINSLMFGIQTEDIENIVAYDGKLLLIIDDYETFTKENKDKIEVFIQKLNTNHHKVLVTTRAASINLGMMFHNNELSENDSVEFLLDIVENEGLGDKVSLKRELQDENLKHVFFATTNGRPLFIYQFAYIMAQKGLRDAKKYKINEQRSAIEFLYGRLYDYLSPKAKNIFVVLSLLVDTKNTVNVIEKAKYIANMENDDDGFQSAVSELEQLKIIRFGDEDNHFFEVYSPEILQMMNDYYQKRDSIFKRNCTSRREQINKDRKLDVEHSLLLSADSNRDTKNEIEVIDSYKQILNRTTSPIDVKMSAILNLASYLALKGKRDDALKCFEEYNHLFSSIPPKNTDRDKYAMYTKMWASYSWASDEGNRKSAVEILLNYARTGFNYSKNYDLELAGMLLQYNSIIAISDWQDLRIKRENDEISPLNFKKERDNQIKDCVRIHKKQGWPLYKAVCQHMLSDYNSGARQNIVGGLYNYTDVLARIHRYEDAIEICQYILVNPSTNFHAQFQRRKEWIEKIMHRNN